MTDDLLTVDALGEWMRAYARILSENKAYLTKLDSPIGDADHGANMDRGFSAVTEKLDDEPPDTAGELFNTVGMTLISTVGGASGPLYGTFFIKAGAAVGAKAELDLNDLVTCLEAGLAGVVALGKAQRGDKTMVDTLYPAIDELRSQAHEGASIRDALASSSTTADAAMKATIPMLAKKGRASYLGERSIGHQDPGATSSYFLIESALQAYTGS